MKFRVTVTRDVTESATIEVEAISAEVANEEALAIARGDNQPQWELDDGYGEPYLPDPLSTEKIGD